MEPTLPLGLFQAFPSAHQRLERTKGKTSQTVFHWGIRQNAARSLRHPVSDVPISSWLCQKIQEQADKDIAGSCRGA